VSDAAPAQGEGVFGRERRALTFGILLAIATFAVEGMGVVPALPTAVRALSGLPLFGWAFSAFMLAWMVGTIAGGLAADARGPRLPMALGLGAFAAGLALAGSAHGMAQFLAGRALQGLGGGGVVSASYVAIARGYPDALRARMMAVTASVWVLPAVVGPAASGAIAEWVGWRWVFAGILPFLAITALVVLPPLGRFAIRQPVAGGRRMLSVLGVATGAGLVIAAPDLVRFGDAATIASAIVGIALMVPGLRALLPRGTFTARPVLPAGLVLRGLLAYAFFGTEAFVPLGAGVLRGATPTQAGLALTAAALGWVSASWAQDRIEAREGPAARPRRVALGTLGVALGIAGVAVALLTRAPLPLVSLGWAVAGAGVGFGYTAGGLICLAEAPAGQEGEVSGQLQLAEALATSAGTGLGGALLAALGRAGRPPRESFAAVFAITLLVAFLGAAVSSRLNPLHRPTIE
jgi:MFS family permease